MTENDRVPGPGRAPDARCRPLTGTDYPEGWTACDEAAWQELIDDVDTDLFVQTMLDNSRALTRAQSLLADP